jgi:uncharacterized membrane-anchored protein
MCLPFLWLLSYLNYRVDTQVNPYNEIIVGVESISTFHYIAKKADIESAPTPRL